MNSNLSFEVKIVYDNLCHEKSFLMGFGFSTLIYNHFTQNYLLFDTGAKSDVLFNNIKMFNVNISDIKKVIISHSHLDHAGSLRDIYTENPEIEIYVPKSNENAFKRAYLNAKIYGASSLMEIERNIYSSGHFDWSHINEQALFLKTRENEIIIVVGCAHPGLEQFILKAKELNNKIKAVIGGFHGFRKYSYLENIEIIVACHCTRYREEIYRKFPTQFKKICVGQNLSF
jgi:7,8-dihydropterin-6-yl-methyl-4-(beta-D-ribofuranosyl)aminobenzene 5'-phosphate synthase